MKDTLYGTVLQTGKCELPLLREWRDKKKAKALRLPFLPGFMLVVRFRNSGFGERLGHMNDRVMPILQRKLDGGITNATSIDASFDIHSPGLHVRLAAMVKLQILRQLGSFLPYPRKFCDGWAVFCPIPASVAIVGQFFAQFPQVLRRVGSLLPCSRKFCEMPALQV